MSKALAISRETSRLFPSYHKDYTRQIQCSNGISLVFHRYNPLASIPFFRRKKETADPRTSFSDPQYLPSTSSSPSSSSSSSSDSNPISTSSIFDQVLEDGTGSGGGSGSGGSGIGEAIDEMRVRERMKKFEDKEGRMFVSNFMKSALGFLSPTPTRVSA